MLAPGSQTIALEPATLGHIGIAIRALLGSGWTPTHAPAGGRLRRNGQLVTLDGADRSVSVRLFVYKVTRSSRGRDQERRVEITSTYIKGLLPAAGFSDVVLGYDPTLEVFVGLDPVRLRHGGPTSNASTFLEVRGLARTLAAPFSVLLRQTRIFPEGEYQAFFRPERLGEYLENFVAIHAGAYDSAARPIKQPFPADWAELPFGSVKSEIAEGGVLALTLTTRPRKRPIRFTKRAAKVVDRGKDNVAFRKLTPAELRAVLQRQEQNGDLGEQWVYEYEKRALIDAGRADLATRVRWVSRRSVGEGYDIASFDPQTAQRRYVEVKATERSAKSFPTSLNEWSCAKKFGGRYHIYRVSYVRTSPTLEILADPIRLEAEGKLQLSPSGWIVKIV